MACISPPEPEEIQLMAYLDGEPSGELEAHLDGCPHCHQRAEDLADFQNRMTDRLYRSSCPSSLQLGEYQLGLLSQDEAESVRPHLSECPHCSGEVAGLQEYLGQMAPDLGLSPLEAARGIVPPKARLARLAPRIRAQHDDLKAVQGIFRSQAEAIARMNKNLRSRLQTLEGGDWMGKGAQAFYREMNGDVLPAVQRLQRALAEAARVTGQISQLMAEAEEQASRWFQG